MRKKNQIKYQILGYAFLVVCFAAIVSLVYYWQEANQSIEFFFKKPTNSPTLNTYKNDQYGFLLKYPKQYSLTEGAKAALPQNYFVKAGSSLATISIPGSTFLTVAVANNISATDCNRYSTGSKQTGNLSGKKKIGTVEFTTAVTEEAAATNKYETKIYRTSHLNSCFEVSLSLHTGNSEVNADLAWAKLQSVFETFRFTDPNQKSAVIYGHVAGAAVSAVQILVYASDAETLVLSSTSNKKGDYMFGIAPNKYFVDYKYANDTSRSPKSVTLSEGQIYKLDFNLDVR